VAWSRVINESLDRRLSEYDRPLRQPRGARFVADLFVEHRTDVAAQGAACHVRRDSRLYRFTAA
jgi:hypothetical protein